MNELVLIGTHRSPYTRKLRLFLHGQDFNFKSVDFEDEKDLTYIESLNVLRKIPILIHGEMTIFESRQIYEYLNNVYLAQAREDEIFQNTLSVIDGITDAGFLAFQFMKYIPQFEQNSFYKIQINRIEKSLSYLEKNHLVKKWDFLGHGLLSCIEWFQFRSIYDCSQFEKIMNFIAENGNRPEVKESRPF
ncbi:MAG: glutathione S-transferase N-terminal domain-containing protein [Halobacteriovoraceae bacterium]|nr:glutathione S-transferase N-terminal domain-containing protein [Halobacteriovoraceae bacterium]